MTTRTKVKLLAWLAMVLVGAVAYALTDSLVLTAFWAVGTHYAVVTLLCDDGDPLVARAAVVVVVAAVGVGTLAALTASWGGSWMAVVLALAAGALAHEVTGRLLAPAMIRAHLDRLGRNLGVDRWRATEPSDFLSGRWRRRPPRAIG